MKPTRLEDGEKHGKQHTTRQKLLGFDLDWTLTQYKSPLGETNRRMLKKFGERYRLIIPGNQDEVGIIQSRRVQIKSEVAPYFSFRVPMYLK